jgi:hypothetical protein
MTERKARPATALSWLRTAEHALERARALAARADMEPTPHLSAALDATRLAHDEWKVAARSEWCARGHALRAARKAAEDARIAAVTGAVSRMDAAVREVLG